MQPFLRPWLILRKLIQLKYCLCYKAIALFIAIGISQLCQQLITGFKLFLQQLRKYVLLHKRQFILICHPELRINIQLSKILPDNLLTK